MSVSQELQYSEKKVLHPQYQLQKLLPQSGSQTTTITTAGGVETLFRISNSVYNLSRSILRFKLTPSAAGAALANNIYNSCLSPVQRIQLYNDNGQNLCDLNNAHKYTDIVWKTDVALEDFLTYPTEAGSTGGANGVFNGIRKSNGLVNSNTVYEGAERFDGSSAATNYTEHQYLSSGGSNNANPIINFRIPLGMIKNTVFARDSDMFVNEQLTLRIVWNPRTLVGFRSDVGAAQTNANPLAGDVTISDITLYMAQERDMNIVNDLKSRVLNEGLKVNIDYVHSFKQNLSGTSQTQSIRFNRAHGKTLKKIYHAVYHNTEADETAYTRSVLADATVKEYYTALNENRIQSQNLDTSNFDDYMNNEKHLKGSVIQSVNAYQYNWCHCDSWMENPQLCAPVDQNKLDGLDLVEEQKWTMNVEDCVSANYNHLTFGVVQRELQVGKEGLNIM